MHGMSITEERKGNSANVPKTSDSDLIKRIAQDRDEAAFTSFFERYKTIAVNLALHITGNSAAAEDAVQEAMLRVWHGAESFNGGNVRGWFSSIVVRESIQVWRGGKRLERKKKRIQVNGASFVAQGDSKQMHQDLEQKEALGVLKGALLELPERQRVMLALHFGAGFSQREVGAELGVSQRAISKAINKSLSHLRGGMKSSGVGAIIPSLLTQENLGEAICSMHESSGKILGRVLERISSPVADASDTFDTNLPEAKRLNTTSLLVGGVAIAVLAVGGVWVADGSKESGSQLPDAAVDQTESIDSNELIHKIWTFEDGPMKGFSKFQGKWHSWRPATNNRPAVMIAGDDLVSRILPVRLSGRPLILTVESQVEKYLNTITSGAAFTFIHEDGRIPVYEHWRMPLINSRALFHSVTYVVGQFMFMLKDGRLITIRKFEKGHTMSTVCLNAHGVSVRRIEIRECLAEEIPKRFHNPERVFAEVMQSPSWVQLKPSPVLLEALDFKRPVDQMLKNTSDSSREVLREAKQKGLSRVWKFKNGPQKELKILAGKWNSWRPAVGTAPAAMQAGEDLVAVSLPVTVPDKYFRIRITVDSKIGNIDFRYYQDKQLLPYRAWFRKLRAGRATKSAVFDAYCVSGYIIRTLNGVPIEILRMVKPFPMAPICFRAVRAAVERVEISEISMSEVPKPFRDPAAFLSAAKSNRSWGAARSVLPDPQSKDPYKTGVGLTGKKMLRLSK